jgi:photosystem II stability/assembly factor-like uncharacterized protein
MRLSLFLSICLFYFFPSNDIHTQQTIPDDLLSVLEWRQLGPFRGGRAGTITGVAHNPNLYYMGTAGGGTWKTKDGGNTWINISDGFYGGSIGAVAVSESDPNIIYVGEGEQTIRGDVSSGKGLWKSTDAGEHWEFIGLKESEHIGRIRVHPTNPDIVYVAAMGNLWKPNDMRGVYKSVDGGKNWKRVLFESNKAGAVDLILDPNNPRIVYASTWQIKRNGYRMDSGGPGSKLWKSTDGGENWTNITQNNGLPSGVLGIIGVTVSPVNSNRLWVAIEAKDGGIFRSDDAGKTWKMTSSNRELRQRAWYYTRLYADTQNEDVVYVLNVGFWKSKDGGETFDRIRTPHGDHHDLWISKDDNQRMAIADDGGGQISFDGGENWTSYLNQPTAQFYRVTTDDHFPYRIYGAQQDNSTVRILHRTSANSITERHWEPTAGGESAHLAPDPLDNNIVYGGTYKGYMMRKDHNTGQTRSTNVWPDNPAGSGAEVMKYRFNWNYPLFFSPHNPKRLYATSNYVHVSENGGQSWEVISHDLTRNDPETIKSSGGEITQDNTGVEFYATIFAAAESTLEEGVLYAASDDGLVHVTRDGGKNWDNITPKMAPKDNMMNCIDIHPTKKGVAYLAATSYKFGDYTPYLYRTDNYGKSWKLITNGIPNDQYTRAIRTDHKREGLLYAGTEWGMYVSFNNGDNWQPLQLNLPIVAIRDLHIKDNSLIAATHGRSFWMIDDLTPLQEMSADLAKKTHYLFESKPAYRMAQGGRGRANSLKEGTNVSAGVAFYYYVNEISDNDTLLLTIKDTSGEVIKTISSKDKQNPLKSGKGGHIYQWDMRYEGFKEFDGMVLYSSPNRGPKAIPGNYTAELSLNKKVEAQTFSIVPDPRMETTQEEYVKQFDYLISVRDEVSKAHQAIIDIRELKSDIEFMKKKLKKSSNSTSALTEELNSFVSDLEVIENNIHMTKNESYQDPLNYGIRINNRLSFLIADQQRGDYAPTDQAYSVRDELIVELDKEIGDLNQLINTSLPKLNNIMGEFGLQLLSDRLVRRP